MSNATATLSSDDVDCLRAFAERGGCEVCAEDPPEHLVRLAKLELLSRRVTGRRNDRMRYEITEQGHAALAKHDEHRWDFSDLTGDATPIALEEFSDESAEDLLPNQIEQMRAVPVGGTYVVDLGAGGVLTYRRVS